MGGREFSFAKREKKLSKIIPILQSKSTSTSMGKKDPQEVNQTEVVVKQGKRIGNRILRGTGSTQGYKPYRLWGRWNWEAHKT